MSCNYAQGLSEYSDKGVCGIPEVQDENDILDTKVTKLVELIKAAKNIVFHTGAGISTSAGIPDFRGPKGVWTLEQKGEKPAEDVSFDRAVPTFAHRFLRALVLSRGGKGVSVVSQNIDGLHIRSGLKAPQLYELHGNMFLDQCDNCARLFVRNSPSPTVGQKYTGHSCPWGQTTGRRPCRGNLCDTILDWEAELPPDDLSKATQLSKQADLSVCLGTTLQIIPSGTLPLFTQEKPGGKLVICNLQPTKYDDRAELVIHGYVDQVLEKTALLLGLSVPEYDPKTDLTRTPALHTFYRTPALKVRPAHLEPEEEYLPPKRKRKFNSASPAKRSVVKREKPSKNGLPVIKFKPEPLHSTVKSNELEKEEFKQELDNSVKIDPTKPEKNGVNQDPDNSTAKTEEKSSKQVKIEESDVKTEADNDAASQPKDIPEKALPNSLTSP